MLTIISIIKSQVLFISGASILQRHGNCGSHVLIYKDADKNIGSEKPTKISVNLQKFWLINKNVGALGKYCCTLEKYCCALGKYCSSRHIHTTSSYTKILQNI